MSEKIFYNTNDFMMDMSKLAGKIQNEIDAGHKFTALYGVPRGGIIVASALSYELDIPLIHELPENPGSEFWNQTIIVDDVVDSGTTREKYELYGLFVCIHKKPHCSMDPEIYLYETDKWIVYFWESQGGQGLEDNVRRLLQYIGEDPTRPGLIETPKRFVKAYDFLFSGYKEDPAALIKTFDETDGYDEMIWLKDIEIYSMCEHHMLPFFGRAHFAYIPNKRIVGVSKIARMVDLFARRLQIQERLTAQITESFMKYLKPRGVGCVIEAQHLCMTMRGVQKQNSIMTTSSLKGVFLDKPEVRQEFMSQIGR